MKSNALYLGDLSRFCTEQELAELFSEFGEVLEVKISRTTLNISLGYGFVSMGCPSQAIEAMEKLRGQIVCGRPLRIDWAARNVKDTNSYAATNSMINSIHVRFNTHEVMTKNLKPILYDL
jgi:RNA recognition motif-containing protein